MSVDFLISFFFIDSDLSVWNLILFDLVDDALGVFVLFFIDTKVIHKLRIMAVKASNTSKFISSL